MTPRIYIAHRSAGYELDSLPIDLVGDEFHYLLRVMRAKTGERIELFDGQGQRCQAELVNVQKQFAQLLPGPWSDGPGVQALSIQLVQGLSSADKMDWTVEKAVELGVSVIQPVFTQRCVIRLDSARAQNKLQHWQRLVIAACRQSGRDRLAIIKPPMDLAAWLALPAQPALSAQPALPAHDRLLLHPPAAGQTDLPLSAWQPRAAGASKGVPLGIDLLIGPEAGFTTEECQLALAAGFSAVQLGPWVLRTETAGLAAVAALQLRFGVF
jgi:16S rRNA (uracil1498-N3)-methyltransferase